MATRLRETAARRPSLPLSPADVEGLLALRESPELLRCLREIADLDIDLQSATESALLQAIFRAGMRAVTDTALEHGYRELGTQRAAEEGAQRAEARRRRPAWADET